MWPSVCPCSVGFSASRALNCYLYQWLIIRKLVFALTSRYVIICIVAACRLVFGWLMILDSQLVMIVTIRCSISSRLASVLSSLTLWIDIYVTVTACLLSGWLFGWLTTIDIWLLWSLPQRDARPYWMSSITLRKHLAWQQIHLYISRTAWSDNPHKTHNRHCYPQRRSFDWCQPIDCAWHFLYNILQTYRMITGAEFVWGDDCNHPPLQSIFSGQIQVDFARTCNTCSGIDIRSYISAPDILARIRSWLGLGWIGTWCDHHQCHHGRRVCLRWWL